MLAFTGMALHMIKVEVKLETKPLISSLILT